MGRKTAVAIMAVGVLLLLFGSAGIFYRLHQIHSPDRVMILPAPVAAVAPASPGVAR